MTKKAIKFFNNNRGVARSYSIDDKFIWLFRGSRSVIQILICFHKWEQSLFLAIDFEKKSLLAFCIREFVLFCQCLYCFQFLSLWLRSRCFIATLISSLNHSGWISYLTLLFFGVWNTQVIDNSFRMSCYSSWTSYYLL